jgi:predicted amidohydrolase YtcJ
LVGKGRPPATPARDLGTGQGGRRSERVGEGVVRRALLAVVCAVLVGCGGDEPRTSAAEGGVRGEGPEEQTSEEGCLILVGTVRTTEGAESQEAVALQGGRIQALGSRDAALSACSGDAREIDLAGATVIPALTDHHVHLLNVGLSLLNAAEGERLFLDLTGITSLEELGERLEERAREVDGEGWILGKGWDQGAWGASELPHRSGLDDAVSHLPVFLTRTDGHAGWANTRALELAGLLAQQADPAGGAILRGESGAPSGVLLERAVEPVVAALPSVPDRDVVKAFRLATEAVAARGVVRAFDAGFLAPPGVVALNLDLERLLRLLVEADLEEPLPIHVHLMIPAPSDLARRITGDPPSYRRLSPRTEVSHLKLYVDGALGSRGGALTHPYADDPRTTGVPRMEVHEIVEWSRRALDAELDVAVHAIGDEAVRRTLDAFEALRAERPGLDPSRLRVEHFSYAMEEDFHRASSLGPVVSMQSNFSSPPEMVPSFGALRVGEAFEDRVYAWRRLHDSGALLAEGSDYFNLPGPPLLNFHAALTARNALGTTGPGPQGRMDALRLQLRRVHPGGGGVLEGRLRPGDPGDLAVLSADLLGVDESELLEVSVRAAFRDGILVHHDGTFPELGPVQGTGGTTPGSP